MRVKVIAALAVFFATIGAVAQNPNDCEEIDKFLSDRGGAYIYKCGENRWGAFIRAYEEHSAMRGIFMECRPPGDWK